LHLSRSAEANRERHQTSRSTGADINVGPFIFEVGLLEFRSCTLCQTERNMSPYIFENVSTLPPLPLHKINDGASACRFTFWHDAVTCPFIFVFCMAVVGCMTLTPSLMSSDALFQHRYSRPLEGNILSYCELLVGGLAVLYATGDVGTSNLTRLRRQYP
jgi:hypothetical protein